MKRLTFAMAMIAATSASAQTPRPGFSAQRPCLTPAEAKGLATFVLPGLVDGLAERCRGTLAREAFLRSNETVGLSERLRREGAASWPIARAAIEKLNGERLPTVFGDRIVRSVAEGTAADLTLKDFDRKDCGAASDLVGGLAPLPSANFASVISALIALGADKDGSPLRICPATTAAR